jgi:hemerythrin-like domain-containing protein
MLVQLGQRQTSEDVVDLLRDCHERIRRFLIQARVLAEAACTDPEEIRAAASQIRRYFTEAFPMHVSDEDEQIVPRLRGASPDVDRALAMMASGHASHGALIARLVAICASLEQDPRRLSVASVELTRIAALLATELEAHLELEERAIFPAVRHLPEHVRDAIRGAIRARRARRARALRPAS